MKHSTNPVHVKNLGLPERWASILAGAALVGVGMKKRSTGGTLLALFGGDLIYCGVTGYSSVYDFLGLPPRVESQGQSVSVPYNQGIRIDKAVTINKPREEVYSFWRNLENLPRFMRHLHSVILLDENRSHWLVQGPAGKVVEWDAEIHNDEPNELIAWRSLPGSDVDSAGSVHFKDAPGGRGTEVLVELQYNPPGGVLGAAIARLMGDDPAKQIKEDLRRLKQMMEAGEIATTEGQPTGKEACGRQKPARAHRAGGASRDPVETASEQSFPASDAPSWTAPPEELAS